MFSPKDKSARMGALKHLRSKLNQHEAGSLKSLKKTPAIAVEAGPPEEDDEDSKMASGFKDAWAKACGGGMVSKAAEGGEIMPEDDPEGLDSADGSTFEHKDDPSPDMLGAKYDIKDELSPDEKERITMLYNKHVLGK